MNDAAFVAAIRDDPDDDLPRLAYADWLDEQGRGQRAEFIRIQIQLSHGIRDAGVSVNLLRRLRELLARHRAEWLGPLKGWAPDAAFERGFVAYLSMSAADFLAHAPEILAAHLVTRLHLRGAAGLAGELAGCDSLGGVSVLDLHGNRGLGDRGVAILAGSQHLGRLRFLDLRDVGGVGESAARALASSPSLAGLTDLTLAENSLGDAGVEALVAALGLPNLARLDLSRNDLTAASAGYLAACPKLAGLAVLRLARNRLTQPAVELLARSPHLANVRVLDVTGNPAIGRGEFGPRVVC